MSGADRDLSAGRREAWLGCAVLAYAVLAYRTAWLSDDAFISLRTVSNWLHGYGLTWNIDERVQTFTHPLWLFALTGAHALTGEPFYSSLYLSLLVSCAAVASLLFARAGGLPEKLLSAFLLCFSAAFIDFSSSGLENPLTHLLLAAFASVYFTAPPSPQRFGWLAVIAGLAALNRLDTVLLFMPALAWYAPRTQPLATAARLALAALPVVAWELFSLLYYGFPFPNTAYAKLTHSHGEALHRALAGTQYLASSLLQDPLTLVTISACGVLALRRRDAARAALLAGATTYLAYVVSIGGDFMNGRFLSAPYFVAVSCLATSDWLTRDRAGHARSRTGLTFGIGFAVAFAWLGWWPPPLTGADYGRREIEKAPNHFGIHNARAVFFPIDSLLHAREMNPARPDHPWTATALAAKRAAARNPRDHVQVIDAIGHVGYYAGPELHIVDHWALADALIARLPAAFGTFGHYPRVLPRGYIETLRSGRNLIADPNLAAYYDELALVIRGRLFDPKRLRAIWRFNTHAYDSLIDAYTYIHTPSFERALHVQNPTAYPCVTTYVWNDWRKTSYVIDTASTRGKTYDLNWQVTTAGARLYSPGRATAAWSGLRDSGAFTLSIAFSNSPTDSPHDVYELRYFYSIEAGQIVVQREPWPAFVRDFPTGPWHDDTVDTVLRVASPDPRPTDPAAADRALAPSG